MKARAASDQQIHVLVLVSGFQWRNESSSASSTPRIFNAGGQEFGDIEHAVGSRGFGGLLVELGVVGQNSNARCGFRYFWINVTTCRAVVKPGLVML